MVSIRATLSAAFAGLLCAMSGDPVRGEAQNVKTFYACESGWTFEVNNNAARCKKGGGLVEVALAPCPQYTLPTGQKIGTARVVDYEGNKDMCVTSLPTIATVALENHCPVTSVKDIRKGLDRCLRANPIQVKAPHVAVQRATD